MIAIPCYRCEQQIPRVIKALKTSSFLDQINHIAIIDNRSPDSTPSIALNTVNELNMSSKVTVYQNQENYGLGGTHKVALQLANQLNMDYIVFIHGDDQGDVNNIASFIDEIKKHPDYIGILGSRFAKGSKLVGYQKVRIYGNLVLNFIYTLVTSRKTTDLGAGVNLLNIKEINKIDLRYLPDHFIFNTELLLEIYKRKLKFISLPITWREEDQQSNAKNFTIARQMLAALISWKLKLKKPIIEKKYVTNQFN